jgi:alpha-beta hydrolase superfamily lysophospholipase
VTVTVFAVTAAILGALAALTVVGVDKIERAHPPSGRFVEVEGGRLHLVELGAPDAPPVVLLHGASDNLGDMRLALGDRLAANYRVILIDRPGHGWSDRPGGRADASPARQAKLVHQALTLALEGPKQNRLDVIEASRKKRTPAAFAEMSMFSATLVP